MNSTKQFLIWGGVIIAIILIIWGMVFLANHYSSPKGPAGAITIENKIQPGDWVLGNQNAKVILTEYADFQCPACGAYYPVVKELESKYGGQVAFVYRHFPLDIHQFSKDMAVAAEAAGKQGKFWGMHDIIFANQKTWENQTSVRDTVIDYARQLNLNVDQFTKDLDSAELKDKINKASDDAIGLGLYYTPTFFLNGKLIDNPQSFDAFSALLQSAVASSTGSVGTTTPAASTTKTR